MALFAQGSPNQKPLKVDPWKPILVIKTLTQNSVTYKTKFRNVCQSETDT